VFVGGFGTVWAVHGKVRAKKVRRREARANLFFMGCICLVVDVFIVI
jgi:hypothetical protein